MHLTHACALAGTVLLLMTPTTSAEICIDKICKYEFVVRETRSMMYAVDYETGWQDVYDVVLNGTRLTLAPNGMHKTVPEVSHDELLKKSNTLDGVQSHVIVINDRFVGPTIEVMEGSLIVVKVINNLQKQALSLHWHGMHQRSTFYMDGVPYFTQCPISPHQSFTYQFIADPPGTHWYHSHFSNQRADGLYGAIIIHRKKPQLPYFELTLSDWYHATSTELETLNPYKTYDRGSGILHLRNLDKDHSFDGVKLSSLGYVSGLINGKGRFNGNSSPLTRYHVTKGLTYRFHLVGASNEYAYQVSIDQHKLRVIETDGYLVEPIEVESLIVLGGETFVFEVEANQPQGFSYWMRAKTLKDGKGPFVRKHYQPKNQVLAVVVYGDKTIQNEKVQNQKMDPVSTPRNCTKQDPCYVLNCFWKEFPEEEYPNQKCITIDQMRSLSSNMINHTDLSFLSPSEEVHEIFLNFAFATGSSINNHRFIFPESSPIYESESTQMKPCTAQCFEDGCKCTNVVKLPLNKTIQLVLMSFTTINEIGKNYSNKAHHPVHLHGHSFYVLKQGFGVVDNHTKLLTGLNDDIVCENKPCSKQHWKNRQKLTSELNFDNPPMKDTVVAPAQGYTVVRFRTDNPGYWLFHCHTMFHSVEGMMLVFDETTFEEDAEREGKQKSYLKPPPPGFPKCNSFHVSTEAFLEWKDTDIDNNSDGQNERSNTNQNREGDCFAGYSSRDLLITLAVMLAIAVSIILVMSVCLMKHYNVRSKKSKNGDLQKGLMTTM